MRRFAIALLAGILLAGCGGQEPPRDVLLVVLDTVRADRTSTHGHERPTTIQMDALARAGVVFEDVTAPAPWTYPSHASLFTGVPPWEHGAHMVLQSPDAVLGGVGVSGMRRDLPTLAERFAAAGYRTVSLSVNDWLAPDLGLVRGFETARVFETDGEAIAAAAAVVDAEDPRPLFLFVNLLSAHSPYREGPGPWQLDDAGFLDPETAPEWVRPYLHHDSARGVNLAGAPRPEEMTGITRYIAGRLEIPADGIDRLLQLYDGGVRAADWGFGQILDHWSRARPDAVVAVTSDHGEAFGEHGMLEHRASVYREVLHVPLVVAAPGRLPAGERVATPVMLQDVGATLLDLAGVDDDPRSLAALANGGTRDEPVTAASWPDPSWAVAAGGRFERIWKLYRRGDDALVWSDGGDVELYDLASDPDMQRDLAATRVERRVALEREAARHFPDVDAEGQALEIPEDTLAHLRELGYLVRDSGDAPSP